MGEATANFITTLYKGGYISIDDLHLAPVRTTTACKYPCGFINIRNIFIHLIQKHGFIIGLMMYCSAISKDILH